MSKNYILIYIIIVLAQINILYLSPIHQINKKNLKNISEKNTERKLQEKSDDIVIIHLNDVHCGLNETIGYDGFVLYRDELKKKYNHVITVDVGDHIQGGTLGAITNGIAILEIMNEIKFDVNILGNHEFDYGIDQLNLLQENMSTQYICANFCTRKDKKPVFAPYQILDVGSKKIAFISIITPLTFSISSLSTLQDSDGNPMYTFLSDKQELYETTQSYINEVKEKGADYIILLTHIGMGMDRDEYTSNDLVSNLEGVDAVLDGHTHKVYTTTSKDKKEKLVYFTQAGTKLENVGVLIIKTDGTITTQIINEIPEPSDTSKAIKLTRNGKDRWVDKDMNNFINNLWKRYEDELIYKVGTLSFDMIIKPDEISPSSSIYCRFRECTLGNLIADSFKEVLSADLSLVNGGDIRTNLLKGNVTRKDLIEVVPFFSTVLVVEVDGQDILDALEFSVSKLPNSFGGFLQVSGVTFDVNIAINSTVVTEQGMFVNISGKRRVSNVKINGADLVVDKKYSLSISEYLSTGGDGYSMFSKYKEVTESVFAESDALIYYIKNNINGKISSNYENEDGRINMQYLKASKKKTLDSKYLKFYGKSLFLLFFYLFF